MIDSKHMNKIVAVCVMLAILFSVFIMYAANAYDTTYIPEYQKRLFNGEIATIDIQIDSEEWQKLLNNPELKEYISGDLVINGIKFDSVGIRTKGNSSLTDVATSESDRYSLNIELNSYVKGQTYYGLDSFCLNNMIGDPTYVREYISYDIMNYIGVPAPLTNYAKVSVNGEDYGFMLVLERYDQSFLDRIYNTSAGNLYNVKNDKIDENNEIDENSSDNEITDTVDATISGGGSLLYVGDEVSSYDSIFANAVLNRTSEEDMQRVITAIKNLNEGTNLEQYWNIDEILRYFAAHTAVVNLNSYISIKEQNYYIYEVDGKITILPWSYHLAFGGNLKTNEKTSNVVNLPIDTPLYEVDMEDRPLLNVLLEVPEYKEKYYGYLRQIVEGYFDSGLFEQTIKNLDAKINEYVKTDVSGFYTYEKYSESLANLVELGKLRAESITGQLNAEIPSTSDGQLNDNSSLINISSVSPLSYQEKLFNGEVVTIDIQVDPDEWQNLLNNAQSKPWVSGDLTINGEVFGSVGVRTKGNSSLSMMGGRGGAASNDSSGNYSLNFKMDKYVDNQTYYGLDVFCVNNMTGDATYMKDYIAYDIMNYIGAPSLLAGYAKITVNGEDYGFGTLLERYDESFTDRVYNDTDGFLYSAKISMGQRGNVIGFGEEIFIVDDNQANESNQANETNDVRANFFNGDHINREDIGENNRAVRFFDGGGFGGSSGGGTLVYTDDELTSYSAILDNAVFGTRTTEEDMQRIIEAIKNLNEGTDLEKYWDVDGALRYFAAHTVSVNLDSYVSNMAQNYYLYEKDGKVTILPWDYNLAFAGYQSGSTTSFVNFPIDTPVSGVNMENRPLLNVLLEIPEYKEKYHQYLREIVEGYFFSGLFENTVRKLDETIKEYVKNDVSAFFTYEQYESAIEIFIEACLLRADSIAGQLDGTIPSTAEGQKADSSALIDASHINISETGSMGGGMAAREIDEDMLNEIQEGFGGQIPMNLQDMPEDFFERFGDMPDNIADWFNGQLPENVQNMPQNIPNDNPPIGNQADNQTANQAEAIEQPPAMPDGEMPNDFSGQRPPNIQR